jgi:hypothetical protein
MLLVICLETKITAVLVQSFSLSCLSAMQVGQALCDTELSESVANDVESFLLMLHSICPDSKILAVLV